MDMKKVRIIYKYWVGISSGYMTYKLLKRKTDELVEDGGVMNACTLGAGEAGVSMAVGIVVATIIDAAI